MTFKTELHCHSRTVSACASISPAELVDTYLKNGYTTVVLMEHLNGATFKEGGHYTGGAEITKELKIGTVQA